LYNYTGNRPERNVIYLFSFYSIYPKN